MTAPSLPDPRLLPLAVRITTAYVSHNHVQASDLSEVLSGTFRALVDITTVPPVPDGPPKPTARQIDQSITHEHIVSFEDGKPYKTLRRHLALFGLTPDEYRAKWGLPASYPMTAPSYSERRSALARALGLGLRHRPNYSPTNPSRPKRPRSTKPE
ncbi:MucR family transcriptional regulator [Methylobacterium aerolatum]|uniref:Transcriptional regulator n=1 Tax=Methylobacterium aerolatum TaxID=418708 RepID=A0ABU0I540_9HYPH|nr:MucR family transcriptional regulator [Methylobacterium aerolatum]MDQ0448990.1 putative transcriptional regulator [Methylobacterium aerolatum]GJD36129.1 Transcriptional regulatory protein ros [Methylobacterium aerolatum]